MIFGMLRLIIIWFSVGNGFNLRVDIRSVSASVSHQIVLFAKMSKRRRLARLANGLSAKLQKIYLYIKIFFNFPIFFHRNARAGARRWRQAPRKRMMACGPALLLYSRRPTATG